MPEAEVVIVVKQLPPMAWLLEVAQGAAVLYCPVDLFGGPGDIDAAGSLLRHCRQIIVHCEGLRRYFAVYAPVTYLDHAVRFVTPLRNRYQPEGSFLWVGVRTNLPPLVAWVKRHPLPGELVVLTNPEDPERVPTPWEMGFRKDQAVRIERWSRERQIELTAKARAALDIKGDDFRARHKPPAKAIDFIALGVPLAMNPDSSPVEHLARMGFDVASPLDLDWWLSREYWEETRRFCAVLRELLSPERFGRRWKRFITEVLTERWG